MLDQVLDFVDIKPYYDLDVMKPNQNLYSLTADIITEIKMIFEDYLPYFAYVQGDTTAAIDAFYSGARAYDVGAELTSNMPFSFGINCQVSGRIADYHFARISASRDHLLKENFTPQSILVTVNTVIDVLMGSSVKGILLETLKLTN
jgi:UDP-N-acetylglucosamine 2-epimerase (non-hydrolysing)